MLKNLREVEILKQEILIVKIWEVEKMSDGLKDCSNQKETVRWDVLYKWLQLPDSVGVT